MMRMKIERALLVLYAEYGEGNLEYGIVSS